MKNVGCYIFSLNHEYFLYDYKQNVILELNKMVFEILTRYIYDQELDADEQVIVNAFLSNGFFHSYDIDPESHWSTDKIAYLSFAPTYQCNFRCSYCFGKYGTTYKGNKRTFTEENLRRMLDFFFCKAFPDAKQYRIDFVSGGEPLLGFDIIKYAIAYIEKYSIESQKKISLWLCTNASLLTNEIIEYLSLHNISIGISIDGRKEKNDVNRVDVFGNGTYDQICKGIKLINK